MKEITVYLEKINEKINPPFYAKYGDAGMDICSNEDISIAPGETKIIKTGLKMAVEPGIEIQVRPRSGLSAKTLIRVCNSPGTIDSGYRDEIGIIIQNTSRDYIWISDTSIEKIKDIPKNHYLLDVKGNPDGYYDIKKGDRIAQIVFCEVLKANLEKTKDISKIGVNRNSSFGESGIR
ncbi:hypothetical protein [Thomasclavelia cocleata]|uniref:dUTP diphosphatase n=1 Tax=Thomasclavelia cocleata TaxID=69824 RepID=UPI00256E9A85|nr:hypothetical protein [Thomasclavelia cocleata]